MPAGAVAVADDSDQAGRQVSHLREHQSFAGTSGRVS